VAKSKGSAYMLSRYEEDQEEATSKLAEALNKTAVVLSQGTDAVLQGANKQAVYLRRLLMCGMGGRHNR